MKRNVILWLAAAVLGFAVQSSAQSSPSPNPNAPGGGNDVFVSDANQRTFVVTGTVVRVSKDRLVVRIADHGHQIPFELAAGVGLEIRKGNHVSVTYHPAGATSQVAERVQVL